jgi:enoyl-CoA hydratase/carnithine racemase
MRVSCSKEGAVWRIGLAAEPGSKVLIDPPGVAALGALLEESATEVGCRVLVLGGDGESFCEGLDLGQVMGLEEGELGAAVQGFAACLRRLGEARQVVIAAVDGAVAGGGLGLCACADLLLATARSSFVLPELALGLLPSLVMPALLERLPPQKVRLLALSGGLDAAQALSLGLVDRLVPDADSLERTLRALIKQALRLDPQAVPELKRLCAEMARLPAGAALELGAARSAARLLDPGRSATLRAFLEGEPLPWFDRYPGRREER